ncbi:acetylglutamate kinase [Bacillus shivajii]|uniref:acetylglutamate kinase n=1 Tax=Bacillus shivajii TaxID=1983719 RepID=UPI001CFC18AA|nr:acetylglutamate kinase [Bacillus shivajii]UCZ53996.1 acetylglutamate kinase [Bacillus shivajii]
MREIIVVKCGGSTIDELSDEFFFSIKALKDAGKTPVIVHGGGPGINHMLKRLNVKSEFVQGLRKTTKEVLEAVEMVLCGKVNKALVTKLQKTGLNAIGISGCDGRIIEVTPIDKENLGFVGEAKNINNLLLEQFIQSDLIPVIAPVGIGVDGERYNINADSAAGAVAEGLGAKQLLFVTDVPGILKDGHLQENVTIDEVEKLMVNGTISGGMIPKVKAAMKSLQGKIETVLIVNGKGTTLSKQGSLIGTKVIKGPRRKTYYKNKVV